MIIRHKKEVPESRLARQPTSGSPIGRVFSEWIRASIEHCIIYSIRENYPLSFFFAIRMKKSKAQSDVILCRFATSKTSLAFAHESSFA